jgi:hypothetical protein
MAQAALNQQARWQDLMLAVEFAEKHIDRWKQEGRLRPGMADGLHLLYAKQREQWRHAAGEGKPVPDDLGLAPGEAGELPAEALLRRWRFVGREIERFAEQGVLPLALSHALRTEAQERIAALQRRLQVEKYPEVSPVEPAATAASSNEPAAMEVRPRRNLMEILLDPRNIQWLLALGGALMVVGLVILLWVNKFFTPPMVAVGLGVINSGLLVAGCWMIRSTRFQLAGKALTLLACLVMPLNLWYYHANNLITIGGHLWVAALVISALYAVAARVLRDELFVYIFAGGVTLTGLLLLADLPPSPQKFWEIALPSTLLVSLGLVFIHLERAFADQPGAFSRKRFGLAFFWSGHAVLGAGLLLLLGADIGGDWLYQPVFASLYAQWQASPSPMVGELRLLALGLVLAGTYAYIYSDIVVRRIGVYIFLAAFTLLWAQVLILEQLNLQLGMSAWITVLAGTALVVHLARATVLQESRYARAFPFLGVLLDLTAVVLGVVLSLRAISSDLRSVWATQPPSWHYIAAMIVTAVSCRVGAYAYRKTYPQLTAVSLFSTAAATLVAATAVLAVLGLDHWHQHAPLLMLIPIAYLAAARLYRGWPEERPLVWVANAATAVMLVSSVASAFAGFTQPVEGQPLNLSLMVFFVEAAIYFALAAAWRREPAGVHLSAAMACGAVWQLLTYFGVSGEYYTLTFALVGMGLLIAYRLAAIERFAVGRLADATFQGANTLLSLSFVAATFLGLSRLATRNVHLPFVGLCVILALLSLLAIALVQHAAWRRWYVVTTIGLALLVFLLLATLSVLTAWQKLEIFCVATGLLLLVVGHIGWYREQDRHNDLVTLSLLLGSVLAGIPLMVATLIDRSQDHFLILNELGFLAVSVLLLATGFLFQLKSTTLTGSGLTAIYFLTLLIFVPWSRLNTVAVSIIVGGGLVFGTGLVLAIYRDRLLVLPEKIKRRQGLFRILSWR